MIFTNLNIKSLNLLLKSVGVFVFISIATLTNAQHYLGIKGSQGFSSVDALPKFDRIQLSSFSPGLIYRFEHKKYAAIQIEANYMNKGYIKSIDTIAITPETTFKITSFELPIMAQGFVRIGPFRPYLTGGAVFGYILNRKVQEKGQAQQDYVFDEYDRRFEYGIAGGGGLGLKISRFELQAEGRYHYNFSFLRDPVIPNNRNTYFNSTQLMFSISLLYRLF